MDDMIANIPSLQSWVVMSDIDEELGLAADLPSL